MVAHSTREKAEAAYTSSKLSCSRRRTLSPPVRARTSYHLLGFSITLVSGRFTSLSYVSSETCRSKDLFVFLSASCLTFASASWCQKDRTHVSLSSCLPRHKRRRFMAFKKLYLTEILSFHKPTSQTDKRAKQQQQQTLQTITVCVP